MNTLLFDWKRNDQSGAREGFNLVQITNGSIANLTNQGYFWAHASLAGVFDVLATDYSAINGWRPATDHLFEVDYFANRVTVRIDGATIFDVAGSFPAGRFGFYNYSQGGATYQLFNAVGSYQSLDGDFSRLVGFDDGSFIRTLKDGTRHEYDPRGLHTATVDRNGNTTRYNYDADGRLLSRIDPAGQATLFAYVAGLLRTVTDPAGRVTTLDHDERGNLTRVTFPDGTAKTFGYDGRHLMTAENDALGHSTTRIYDATGRFVQSSRADGTTRAATNFHTGGWIDPAGGTGTAAVPASVVRPDAVTVSFTDGRGALSTFATDAFGHLTRRTDANGLVTLTNRDANGNPIRTTRPDGSVVNRAYDTRGNQLTETEAFNGAVRRTTYDPAFSLVSSMTDPLNHTTTLTRDAAGNVTRQRDPLGHETTFTYDARGLTTSLTDPNGLVTTFSYTAAGLPETRTETPPAGGGAVRITRFTYDAAGQPLAIVLPDGVTLTLAYDLQGRLLSTTDNLGNRLRNTYDAEGNLVGSATFDPDGTLVLRRDQVFDTLHRLSAVIEPHDSVTDATTTIDYDGAGSPVQTTDPNGHASASSYDPGDRLRTRTDALGGVITYAYDTLGNPATVTAPNGAATGFSYDPLSRLTAETSPDRGNLSHTYDSANRRLTLTDARGITATYTYDALDRLLGVTYPDPAENITFTYDACPFGIGRLCAREDA
ncbi:MAG: hypothetical protein WAZ48_16880, partial [Lysobacteraceae bacterium]